MSRIGHWLQQVNSPHPLDTKCPYGTYKGWYWRTVCEKDPNWVLWIITESRLLLDAEIHEALVRFLKAHQWD